MNQPTQPAVATETRPATTERAIAWTTTLAPIAVGTGAPFLNSSAALLTAIAYGGTAGFLATNYMNRLPPNLLNQLPAGDIIRAHRSTLFGSTLTTGMALLMGTVQGPVGADALMAGILDIPAQPIPGIVSLGWWAAVALIPYKLRRVLARPRKAKAHSNQNVEQPTQRIPQTPAEQIAYRWWQIISNPDNGTNKGQDLTIRTLTAQRWTGHITALPGQSVTVTADTVSSAYRATPYQASADWITITPGAHTGEAHITVNLQAPPELDPTTLSGAWRKWAARNGGVMAGTHLEEVQHDPNTGGEVARVVANEDRDSLPTPNLRDLVGALRTNHLLLSYEPSTNPRTAV
ncbi:MAG TPA: hypothetical protein VFH70_04060, partial [Acidimicrobiales bacterium]|nr:hypothetical protein [Acidimicrobiales bacterium]